ncbi:MAG: DNA translocase FtsK [Bacillota bacterium]|nr:DNA translocase FtsK [Bacillota bacterium]
MSRQSASTSRVRKQRRREPDRGGPARDALHYDLWGIASLVAGGLVLIALTLPSSAGPVGIWLKRILRLLLGDASYGLVAALLLLGAGLVWRHRGFAGARRWLGAAGLLLLVAAAMHAWALSGNRFAGGQEWEAARLGMGGGVLGRTVWLGLTRAFGSLGAWVVGGAAALASTLALTGATVAGSLRLAARTARLGVRAWSWLARGLRRVFFVEVPEAPEPPQIASPAAGELPVIPALPALSPVPPPAPPPGAAPTASAAATSPPELVADRAKTAAPGATLSVSGSHPAVRRGARGPDERQLTLDLQLYQPPPLNLLEKGPRERAPRGDREIADKARLIEETLASFGVKAKVVEVSRGPAVTRFEVHPGPGVKVSRITTLADDIALSLAAADVRIEPRIPGKSAIGVEVPNRQISMVTLRDVLESPEFTQSPSPLTIALGKDVAGRPVVPTLDSLLHLLIAGATGSGKSVCLNAIISSILFKARPHEVKFILVDPKVVELSVFDGIPHLLAPVVADPKKAAGVLRWVVEEMVQRWRLFADAGVRDIGRYNQAMVKDGNPSAALPFIVVVIDELADLVAVAPVELEEAVQRLAQMGRAAGIHLVMATQRPSADVVTGTIKANIPSRVAFAVASQVDSRIVLDMPGAERLVGRGDMLFLPMGASKPIRAQGAYISEQELEALVKHCAAQASPQYDQGILQVETGDHAPEMEDDMFPQAVRVVVEARQASASLLQRRLRVGYTRAARLIDMMEARGFVSAYDGTRPREVFLSMEEYRRLFPPPDRD